jgi:hypothetical protein
MPVEWINGCDLAGGGEKYDDGLHRQGELTFGIRIFVIGILFGFRISDFGFCAAPHARRFPSISRQET